jgi:hypothetical protein
MKTAATWFLGFAILVAVVWQPSQVAKAQNPTLTPYQFSVSNVPHTSCTVSASTTQYCFASDGPYVSISGAAYVSMLPNAGVTITGTDPIAVSSTGVVSLSSDAALHTLIDNLALTATVPTNSVPSVVAPVK